MRHARVLIVDNDDQSLKALCELLNLWGYEVDRAGLTEQIVAEALARRPNAVVMDLGLPDSGALNSIRLIKTQGANIYLIAVSGWSALERAALRAGADAFVLKPDLQILEGLLARLDVRSEPTSAAKMAIRP